MADNRFHGLATGSYEQNKNACVLRVDQTKVISSPPPLQKLGIVPGKRVPDNCHYAYKTECCGFHFGCIPCSFFRERSMKWNGSSGNGLWFVVEDRCDDGGTRFLYRIGKDNVTRYFGQTELGINEAF